MRADVIQRKHRGSGGLLELYPRTVNAWRAAHPEDVELDELLAPFLESSAFEAYRETSLAGPGVCLEESFFRFCDAQGVGDGATLEDEFFTAMMKALVVSPCPDFTLPKELHCVEQGFFAVGQRGPPMLYAAVRGNLVLGPITPLIADLLLLTTEPLEIARNHGVTNAVLLATLDELTALGLK